MPADRFLHPRMGHSGKVSTLTDQEFRVWITYIIAADDYGVMRREAVAIQAASDRLARLPARSVERSLDSIFNVGLWLGFEHQARPFVCQFDWQDWQKIRYPRESVNPVPPPEVLAECSPETTELFLMRSGKIPETFQRLARAGGREWLTANGEGQTAAANGNGLRARFDEFWAVYPKKVGKDAAWRAWQKRRPTAEQLALITAALAWQVTQDAWTKDAGQFVPHPATWLNRGQWDDEPGVVVEGRREFYSSEWVCPHGPPKCAHRAACAIVAARTPKLDHE